MKPFFLLLGWNVVISVPYVGGTDTRALADGKDWSQNLNKSELKSYNNFSHSCETCVRCLISSFLPVLTASWVVLYIYHPLHNQTQNVRMCTCTPAFALSPRSYWLNSACLQTLSSGLDKPSFHVASFPVCSSDGDMRLKQRSSVQVTCKAMPGVLYYYSSALRATQM